MLFRVLVRHDDRTIVGKIVEANDDIRSKLLVEMGYLEPVELSADERPAVKLKPKEPPKGSTRGNRKSGDRSAEGEGAREAGVEPVSGTDGDGHRDGGEAPGTGPQAE